MNKQKRRCRYDAPFREGNLDSPEWIYSCIEPESSVLDVGCNTGNLGEKLIDDKRCRVTGIDVDIKALEQAKNKLDDCYYLDLEKEYYSGFSGLKSVLSGRCYDYIVMGDIYEHLKNGPEIFRALCGFLKEDGRVVISVPNIQHYIVRLKILLGLFQYHHEGILDASHCRFFTLSSLQKEMNDLGFTIDKKKYVGKLFFNHRSVLYYIIRLIFPTRKIYCRFQYILARCVPSLFAYQVVLEMSFRKEKNSGS